MLESLGLTAKEESVYMALLGRPHQSVNEVARELRLSPQTARTAVRRLEELGFVSRRVGSGSTLVATSPDVAVNALVVRRTEEFAEAQRQAQQLAEQHPKELQARPDELVEIVVGKSAVEAQFAQLSHAVTAEMLVLDRPPYAQEVTASNVPETDLLAAGAQVRGIYAPEAFEMPGAFEQAMESVRAGEQPRVHGHVPMKLAVGDRVVALLPLTNDGVVDSALVVRAPMVVAALVQLFEMLWEQACPLPTWEPSTAAVSVEAEVDHELLARLATGMKDEAIARELGVSVRTLGRRTASLLQALGARTRFQAGLQAARRGLDWS
ncbi:MAG: helix-turn-helix domain-containing protein [Nocardioidaceae bacterium]